MHDNSHLHVAAQQRQQRASSQLGPCQLRRIHEGGQRSGTHLHVQCVHRTSLMFTSGVAPLPQLRSMLLPLGRPLGPHLHLLVFQQLPQLLKQAFAQPLLAQHAPQRRQLLRSRDADLQAWVTTHRDAV